MHKQSGNFLDTTKGKPGEKWIFVMSTSKKLYAGQVSVILRTRLILSACLLILPEL